MKKILLSVVALVAAMSVNAQGVVLNPNDELGLGEDGLTLTANSVIGTIDGVLDFKIGADDTYKKQDRGPITVNGNEIGKGGLQGSTNPKDADGGTPSSTLKVPVSGAYFSVDVKKDGYLYVFQQASSNKSYTVFENEKAIGYTYSAVGDATTDLGAQYGYVLEGAGDFNWLEDAGITSVEWPEQIVCRANGKYNDHCEQQEDGSMKWTKNIAKGGLGVIKFAVFAGCNYVVNANGSKMTAASFFFDETGDATITVASGDNTITLLDGGKTPTGISSTKVALNENGTIYNVAGQKVSVNYKGLVIKNGKKMIQK